MLCRRCIRGWQRGWRAKRHEPATHIGCAARGGGEEVMRRSGFGKCKVFVFLLQDDGTIPQSRFFASMTRADARRVYSAAAAAGMRTRMKVAKRDLGGAR